MKNWKRIVPVLLIAVCMTPLALASETLALQVPYGFTAGTTHFPPGDYVLTMDKVSPGTVLVQGPKNAIFLSVAATAGKHDGKPIVSFSAYGEKRFLSAIQTARRAWSLIPSTEEIALARNAGEPVVAQFRARTGQEQ